MKQSTQVHSLCLRGYRERRIKPATPSTSAVFLILASATWPSSSTVRLGNVLFELASSYCIAQLNNLTLVIENASETSHLQFQGIRIPKLAWKYLDTVIPIQGLPSGLCCVFKEELLHVPASNTSFKMGGYFQSWKYFEHCEETVKKALAFKEDVVIKARRYVREWRDRFPNRTLVGMHVRLGRLPRSQSRPQRQENRAT